jgi:branched-subunit amino acid aminotransferase/4-amino-4-deoxychorismate lyase
MHYFLAEQEVRMRTPKARPLLVDHNDTVNETPTANVVAYWINEGFVSPPRDRILEGISLLTLIELGKRHKQEFTETTLLQPFDLRKADEVLITSTPFCLLPVVQLDDAPIGDGRPGPLYRRLLEWWSGDVGVDIAAQAKRFAKRG